MKKVKWVSILLLMAALLPLLGCSQPEAQTPTPKYDIPSMSSREVIILVIEYTERQLGITPTQPQSSRKISGDFDAAYLGDGTWLVRLPEPGEGSYQWIVHENNKSVQYLGLRH